MKSFKIKQNDQGQRLNKFIKKAFLNVPNSLIYKSIRKKNIKINKKALKANYILNFGDLVEVYGLDEFFIKKEQKINFKNNNFEKLDIVFEDENILVINKKREIMSQPNSKQKNSLIDFVIKYLIKKKNIFQKKKTALCQRFAQG